MEVSQGYPEVSVQEMLVDAAAMRLVLEPETFDVIVTTNLFGDILSDEAAAVTGGIGLAPSGNVGNDKAIFEPVHGSAPDIAGKGIANPTATILASAMMLDHLKESGAANRLRKAVGSALADGACTPDLGGELTTNEAAHAIIDRYHRAENGCEGGC
jgi:homoisocitrate dehydrogenase